VDIYKTDGPSMTKTKASPLVSPAYQLRPAETGELKLTNDGQLSLFFVGVGSAFSKRHFQTNLLIVKGQDHVLVDCGTKTPQALYELGLPLPEIRNYFLTHSHADHIGGLEEVMLVNRYGTGSKPHVWITEGYQNSLWDMSLKGGGAFNEESDGKNLSFGDFWAIHRPQWLAGYPRETYGFEVGSIRLKAFRTMHVPGNAESWERAFWSTGLVIDDRILFTGDTKFDRSLVEDFTQTFPIETIYHDCQFLPPGGVHASFDELKTLDADLRAKTVLMHYGDNWEPRVAEVAQAGFAGLARQWTYYDFPAARTRGKL
jgi:ribonuclease BN (tRNA processing enzyme)